MRSILLTLSESLLVSHVRKMSLVILVMLSLLETRLIFIAYLITNSLSMIVYCVEILQRIIIQSYPVQMQGIISDMYQTVNNLSSLFR